MAQRVVEGAPPLADDLPRFARKSQDQPGDDCGQQPTQRVQDIASSGFEGGWEQRGRYRLSEGRRMPGHELSGQVRPSKLPEPSVRGAALIRQHFKMKLIH